MKAKFDFTDVDSGFELLPKGDYVVHLFDVDLKKTQKGDDMYVLILKVAEGEHKSRQLFYNLPVMPTTMWKIKETLEVLGVEVPKGSLEIDFDEIMGSKVVAVVEHSEWQGREREDVVNLKEYEGSDDGDESEISISEDDVPF